MELQEINEVIGHVPGERDALAAGTSSDVLAGAQATNSSPRSPPYPRGVVQRVPLSLLYAPRPRMLLASAPQLTRSMPLQEHSLRVQGPSIGQQRQQDILPRMR